MDFPLNMQVNGKEISTHFVMEILSIFIGIRFYMYRRKRVPDSISDVNRLIIFVAVCAGALLGSRLIGVLEEPSLFLKVPSKFVYIFSTKTVVGALLFALFSVELTKKIIGVKSSSGDMMTYPLILGLILGRIGCFCEGLGDNTIGGPTSLFTGINFGDGILRHPLPLYEIVFLTGLWLTIYLLEKRRGLADGAAFKLFLINYFLYRFLVEFLKENKFTIMGLSTIQLCCLLGLVYYLKTLLSPRKLFVNHA